MVSEKSRLEKEITPGHKYFHTALECGSHVHVCVFVLISLNRWSSSNDQWFTLGWLIINSWSIFESISVIISYANRSSFVIDINLCGALCLKINDDRWWRFTFSHSKYLTAHSGQGAIHRWGVWIVNLRKRVGDTCRELHNYYCPLIPVMSNRWLISQLKTRYTERTTETEPKAFNKFLQIFAKW